VRGALDAVTAAASHLRWRIAEAGAPVPLDELSCGVLATDPDAVAAAVAATAEGRGSDDPQVLASLWWQAYAYRVAGTALACWLLTGTVPDVRAEAMAVGVARSRPSSVVYLTATTASGAADRSTAGVTGQVVTSGADLRAGGDTLGVMAAPVHTDPSTFVDRLFGGHLDLVAAGLRSRHPLGAQLVWGNVAAACASGIGAVHHAAAPGWPDRLANILAAAPHGLAALGQWSFPDHGLGFRRRTCCLWWKTTVAEGALCADCSLRPRPVMPEGTASSPAAPSPGSTPPA
jgi:hypothetical protein